MPQNDGAMDTKITQDNTSDIVLNTSHRL